MARVCYTNARLCAVPRAAAILLASSAGLSSLRNAHYHPNIENEASTMASPTKPLCRTDYAASKRLNTIGSRIKGVSNRRGRLKAFTEIARSFPRTCPQESGPCPVPSRCQLCNGPCPVLLPNTMLCTNTQTMEAMMHIHSQITGAVRLTTPPI